MQLKLGGHCLCTIFPYRKLYSTFRVVNRPRHGPLLTHAHSSISDTETLIRTQILIGSPSTCDSLVVLQGDVPEEMIVSHLGYPVLGIVLPRFFCLFFYFLLLFCIFAFILSDHIDLIISFCISNHIVKSFSPSPSVPVPQYLHSNGCSRSTLRSMLLPDSSFEYVTFLLQFTAFVSLSCLSNPTSLGFHLSLSGY